MPRPSPLPVLEGVMEPAQPNDLEVRVFAVVARMTGLHLRSATSRAATEVEHARLWHELARADRLARHDPDLLLPPEG